MQLEELKDRRQEKLDWVEEEGMRFGELKKQVAIDAISSRSGKPIPQRVGRTELPHKVKM